MMTTQPPNYVLGSQKVWGANRGGGPNGRGGDPQKGAGRDPRLERGAWHAASLCLSIALLLQHL